MTDPTRESLAAALTEGLEEGSGSDTWTQREVYDYIRERVAALPSPAPEPLLEKHGVAIRGDYGVTCTCSAVLSWPAGWSHTETAAQRLVDKHSGAAQPAPDSEAIRLLRRIHDALNGDDLVGWADLMDESAAFLQARESGGEAR